MWQSDKYTDKATIYKMYFSEKLRYNIQEVFRTATLALPIAVLSDSKATKNSLVEMPGVEPGCIKNQTHMSI